ncbi:hypothetical protein GE061_019703 [Apolygus lucorum]|uniref:Homologous-pairing protein 2 homolog n=1 Tax=Apolygus lucorum TaxID=248454 RepID=A0A8S9X8U7_APOLU|nr:hypothetical protein GE061_019703 [Apolygus lucorum]
MPYCAIYGCTNHNQNSTVKFYTFPKDKALCQKWKHLCYREDHINVRTATICSVHFSSDSFDTPLKYKLLNYRPKNLRDLKKDAIPSLHLPRPQRKECKSSRENRMERKEQRGILKNILIESNLKSTFQNSEPSSTHSDEDNESRQDLSLTPINSRAEDGQMIVLMTSVNEEITSLKEENRQLKTANDILVQTNQELKYENQSLRSELENLKTYISTEVNNKIHESLSRIFTPGQITSLLSQQQPKKILWKNDDIASAISLRSISSKCYRYLRIKLHYPLPAPSTLRKWIARIEFSPGILHNVLTIMKNKSNKADNFRKIVALSFDEMSLSKLMDFDTKKEMVIGPHNNVQVVFVRAINANWKQPIFYNFDEAMKRDVLFDIINSVERAVAFLPFDVNQDLRSRIMATQAVEKFMKTSNRPYSANDVVQALKDVNKTVVQKSLDQLVSKGSLSMKEYGKQKIYCAVQRESLDSDDEDKDIDSKIESAQSELNKLKQELMKAEAKLKSFLSSRPTEEVVSENQLLEKEIESLQAKLMTLENAENTLTEVEVKNITAKWDSYVKEYRKRKRIVTDILDQILEGYPKSKKQLIEEIGVEDDESVQMPKLV